MQTCKTETTIAWKSKELSDQKFMPPPTPGNSSSLT